jgi:hypothetical protein
VVHEYKEGLCCPSRRLIVIWGFQPSRPCREEPRFVGGQGRLGREGDVLTAYQATISEGMVADQVAILNRSLLLELWPELILSARVRSLWEIRFPELAATA